MVSRHDACEYFVLKPSVCSVIDVIVCNVMRKMLGRTGGVTNRNKRSGGARETGQKKRMTTRAIPSMHTRT